MKTLHNWFQSWKIYNNQINLLQFYASLYEGKSKSKGSFQNKKHIYCEYTEMKLISLFNVIPLDFNAPVPALHKFFNSVRKESFLVGL
jgi:hypothetical protein